MRLGALQTLLLSGAGDQTGDADAIHVNKRPRLDSAIPDLGNEDGAAVKDEVDDEVPILIQECSCNPY